MSLFENRQTYARNEDGLSLKGCSYIYAPKGQAGEYSPLASNPYRGCGHGCVYCYVPKVLKMDRKEFDAGAEPRPNFMAGLLKDAKKYQAAGITAQVMLSFTSDPYHHADAPDAGDPGRARPRHLHLDQGRHPGAA